MWKEDWEILRWTFRQAIVPRRVACGLFAGLVLFDLGISLDVVKGLPYLIFLLVVLLIVLWVASYRREGKWYDWKDARSEIDDEWKYIKDILMPTCAQANQCADSDKQQQQKEGRGHYVDALDRPKPPWKGKNYPGMLILCVVLVIVVLYSLYLLCWSDKQSVIDLLLSWRPKQDGTAVLTNDNGAVLGAVLVALTTAAAAVMTIFMTVRQNTRSVNRQAWINSIRELMAGLIADMPYDCDLEGACDEHRRRYFKLALYLNPSETAHQGFLYAIAVMYGAENDWWARDCPRELKCLTRCGACLAYRRQRLTLLSNVILKIEWEQVKKLT